MANQPSSMKALKVVKAKECDPTPQRQRCVGRDVIPPLFNSINFQLLGIISLFLILSPIVVMATTTGDTDGKKTSFAGSDVQMPGVRVLPALHYENKVMTYARDGESESLEDGFFDSRVTRSGGGDKMGNNNAHLEYNRLSRALQRIHFGPFLRLTRPVMRETPSRQFNLPNSREKKALSFFSRFYPVLQHGSDFLMDGGYTPRRRVSFPHSAEGFAVSRFSRPIMRLRWGK